MTPKEKAEELINKFWDETPNELFYNPPIGASEYNSRKLAIYCALIAVNEILDLGLLITDSNKLFVNCDESQCLSYWLQVKIELEKL